VTDRPRGADGADGADDAAVEDRPGGLPDLGALLGGGEGGGLGALFEQAQQMAAAHAAAADAVLEGVAGGGAVRVEATGHGEFRKVTIARSAVDPDDVEMLEDLVLAALHDVSARIAELQQQSMGGLSLDALGGLLPGADPEPG
jgi:DNA-binding YbaB/EbfC family protein